MSAFDKETDLRELFFDENGSDLKRKPTTDIQVFKRLYNIKNIHAIDDRYAENKYYVKKSTEDDGYSGDYYGGRKRSRRNRVSKKRTVSKKPVTRHRRRKSNRRYSRRK